MKRRNLVIGIISSSMVIGQPGSVLPNPALTIPSPVIPANMHAPGTIVIGLEAAASQTSPALKLRNEPVNSNFSGPLVIASIGESYAAGEGNPNRESGIKTDVEWQPLGPIFDANGHLRR